MAHPDPDARPIRKGKPVVAGTTVEPVRARATHRTQPAERCAGHLLPPDRLPQQPQPFILASWSGEMSSRRRRWNSS